MPKIIFTSQYMRDDPPAQFENHVKYIGTRDGVEKIDESKLQYRLGQMLYTGTVRIRMCRLQFVKVNDKIQIKGNQIVQSS